MAAPGDRHGPLPPMMVALTFVTGVVDAASYLKLGHVFVANMTGNVVFLGFALAGAGGLSISASLLALASFLAGALAGGRLGARIPDHRGHLLRAVSAVQLSLFAVALVIGLLAVEPLHEGIRYALLVVLALAMGMQNATAQRLRRAADRNGSARLRDALHRRHRRGRLSRRLSAPAARCY